MKTTPFGPLPEEPARDFARVPESQRRSGCDDDDPSLPALWNSACALYDAVVAVFGAASDLARRSWLSPLEKTLLPAWLQGLEKLVRGLILVAALQLRVDLPPHRHPGASVRKAHDGKPVAMDHPLGADSDFSSGDPESWRACFRPPHIRLLDEANEAEADAFRDGSCDSPDGASEDVAWNVEPSVASLPPPANPPLTGRRLAIRIEALRRLLANPDPHIRRLAFRIARAERRWNEPFDFCAPLPGELDRRRRRCFAGWQNQRVHEHINAAVAARRPDG